MCQTTSYAVQGFRRNCAWICFQVKIKRKLNKLMSCVTEITSDKDDVHAYWLGFRVHKIGGYIYLVNV